MAWLWFAPLFAVGLLHFWLQTRIDALPTAEPIIDAPYVQTLAGDSDAAVRALIWQASKPLVIGVLVLAVVLFISWLAIRRWGWARVTPVFTGLWCVICAGVALALIARYVNLAYMTPLPPVTATVFEARPYPSTEHGPGGAVTWLTPPASGAQNGASAPADNRPWRVHIEGADFQAMPPGTSVTLQRARGALWGTYMTNSNAPQALPFSPMPAPGQPATTADPS